MGLSFTLVFVLSYAVYGATIDTQYHLYSTDRVQSESNLTLLEHTVIADDDGDEVTVWLWQADVVTQPLMLKFNWEKPCNFALFLTDTRWRSPILENIYLLPLRPLFRSTRRKNAGAPSLLIGGEFVH